MFMDKDEVVVSIRCLAYNHEPYIRQCLDGFVMQKTNFKVEVIVHDDASTDGTAAIIREYAEKYPELIKPIFETENQYSKHDGSLRRIMNEACIGKYIAMCEGDDYWIDPYKLQKQVDFLEEHPEYYVVGMRSLVYYQHVNKYGIYRNSLHWKTSFSISDYVLNILMHTSTFCIRRESMMRSLFVSDILQSDISLILHSWASLSGKIKVLKDFGSVYRKHEEGITNSTLHMNIRKSCESMIRMLNSFDAYSEYRVHNVVCYQKKKIQLLLMFRLSSSKGKIMIVLHNFMLLQKICMRVFRKRSVESLILLYLYLCSGDVKNYVRL